MVSCISCKKQISGTVMTLIHDEFLRRYGDAYEALDWRARNRLLLDIWKELEGKFWSYDGPVTKDELSAKVPVAEYVELYGEKMGLAAAAMPDEKRPQGQHIGSQTTGTQPKGE